MADIRMSVTATPSLVARFRFVEGTVMNLTDEEQRIVVDAERLKGHPLPRFALLGYVSAALLLCAGILGLWERGNVPQYLLLIGFAAFR